MPYIKVGINNNIEFINFDKLVLSKDESIFWNRSLSDFWHNITGDHHFFPILIIDDMVIKSKDYRNNIISNIVNADVYGDVMITLAILDGAHINYYPIIDKFANKIKRRLEEINE